MPQLRIPLRVVFYRDEDHDWIAHCLEFDLCGHGPDRDSALHLLVEAIGIQVRESLEHENKANLFTPADGRFFAMFAEGNDVAMGELELLTSVTNDQVTAREFTGNCHSLQYA